MRAGSVIVLGTAVVLGALAGVGCGSTKDRDGAATEPGNCPERETAPELLPNVKPEHRTAAYWVQRTKGVDDVVLDAAAIARHNRALDTMLDGEPLGQMDLRTPLDPTWLTTQLETRFAFVREKIESGTYLDEKGQRIDLASLPLGLTPATAPPRVRVATGLIELRCAPTPRSFYTKELNKAFDRNLCTTIRPQELVEVLGAWGNEVWLARSAHTLGWIAKDAPLSRELRADEKAAWLGPDQVIARHEFQASVQGETVTVPAATILPSSADHRQAWMASRKGVAPVSLPTEAKAEPVARPFTKRALFEEAFSLLDTPYGWGGYRGGRDCSLFLLDVLARFGLHIPRNSARQALGGSFGVNVENAPTADKLAILDAASEHGVALLHFPGHIMLYLGRNDAGTPMAIHSFAEYLEPCAGGGETLRTVDRITVSDLTLGHGTSRKAFLERITRIAVFAPEAGPKLEGIAEYRPAARVEAPPKECVDSADDAIFRSPAKPNAAAPLRVIATSTVAPGAASLVLFGPTGQRVDSPVRRFGGPPFVQWTRIDAPAVGDWKAVVADGDRVVACETIRVQQGPSKEPAALPETELPAWDARMKWERDTENLYAAFVQQLFDYPMDEDKTWTDLQSLLREPEKNLVLDHLGAGEDAVIALKPDCADLPYFLRAYFAWKLRLPFGLRQCSRGRAGVPPRCGEPITNLTPVAGATTVDRFGVFIRRVASGVHSATARTVPNDDNTDLYPVPLRRDTLLPGTVFADPYGHLLVVSGWIPQRPGGYGMLIGSEAQPDGTIGRRRFWQGTFLFTPETTDVGAGFKAWRPLVYDAREKLLVATPNADLQRAKDRAPFSTEQYEGTKEDWYDRVEALTDPRPLDPARALTALVDALEESVKRRVLSVQNGIEHMNETGWARIAMPDGYDIFETEGAWEDYATPSRDLRLLIAIDAVMGFPAAIERSPQRFGVDAKNASTLATTLRTELGKLLAERSWSYVRSDGGTQSLKLADVVARTKAFEMTYNINDCVEVRWAAPEGSPEAAACKHHTPPDQVTKMEKYRSWFATRTRPPR